MRKTKPVNADDALFIEKIYKQYHQLMFSVVKRFGIRTIDQEDVVSTVMISLLNNAGTLRDIIPEKRQYYITRALISVSTNFLRKQKAQKEKRCEGLLSAAESSPNLEERIVLKTELMNVISSIMSLPEKESQCIRLKYLSGYTNEEIAGMTGLSVNSVNQYIMRARKHIRTIAYGNEKGI